MDHKETRAKILRKMQMSNTTSLWYFDQVLVYLNPFGIAGNETE